MVFNLLFNLQSITCPSDLIQPQYILALYYIQPQYNIINNILLSFAYAPPPHHWSFSNLCLVINYLFIIIKFLMNITIYYLFIYYLQSVHCHFNTGPASCPTFITQSHACVSWPASLSILSWTCPMPNLSRGSLGSSVCTCPLWMQMPILMGLLSSFHCCVSPSHPGCCSPLSNLLTDATHNGAMIHHSGLHTTLSGRIA